MSQNFTISSVRERDVWKKTLVKFECQMFISDQSPRKKGEAAGLRGRGPSTTQASQRWSICFPSLTNSILEILWRHCFLKVLIDP